MKTNQENQSVRIESALAAAKSLWPDQLTSGQHDQLKDLITRFSFSPVAGDLQLLSGHWYVTHAGLLRLANRKRCRGIHTEIIGQFCDRERNRWVIKATVLKTSKSLGFVGYGDADPTNISPLVRGAEMRIAETRAVNRALRKAYGIGICSVEELGGGNVHQNARAESGCDSCHGDGQPRLRDRLLLLIRQHQLDPEQVKRYATHFCGTSSLHEASRGQVEKLIEHLSALAAEGHEKLAAELEGFCTQGEGVSAIGTKNEEAA